ncbi:unnamed protein product, partial [Brassica oleracea]
KERKASTLPFVGFLHLRRNALLVVSFTSISDGSFSLTTSFVSITSVTSSSLPTRQTRNRFRLNHIQLQLQGLMRYVRDIGKIIVTVPEQIFWEEKQLFLGETVRQRQC